MKRKVLKFVLWTLLSLLAVILLLLLTSPLWLGSVVCRVANVKLREMTGTDSRIEALSVNPFNGRIEAAGVVIGNPPGYPEQNALVVGKFVLDVDPFTLLGKRLHVEEVVLQDVNICNVVRASGERIDNFEQIEMNMSKRNAPADGVAEPAPAPSADVESAAGEPAAAEEEPRRFVIDRLLLTNVRVRYRILDFKLPSFELHDLGNDGEGIDYAELSEQVWSEILSAGGQVGEKLKSTGEQLKKFGEAFKKGKLSSDDVDRAVKSVRSLLKF